MKSKKAREKKHPYHPWLPAPDDTNFDLGQSSNPGEPAIPRLYAYANDKSMRCEMELVCCDCGLVHLYTFEVFRASDKKWYLAKRSYRSIIATDAERKHGKYPFREVLSPVKRKGKKAR